MQNNRHTNTAAIAALPELHTTEMSKKAAQVLPSSNAATAMVHSKRPDLEEIVRSLYDLGRSDVADRITDMTGVVRRPSTQELAAQAQHDTDGSLRNRDATVADASPTSKQKYLRGRYRFAYIYVNSATASLDEQTKILTAFLKASKVVAKTCPYTAGILKGNYEVVPITLPRNFVTLSIRVNMDALKHSKLLAFAEKYQTMKVYFRKPRKDTQHLADQLKQQQQKQTKSSK